MRHVLPITQMPRHAQGVTTPAEGIIELLITVFFRHWDNFPSVIRNLQKYYAKTP